MLTGERTRMTVWLGWGRLRDQLVAWLALVAVAFGLVRGVGILRPVTWVLKEREFFPFVGMGIARIFIAHDILWVRVRTHAVAWLILFTIAFGRVLWVERPFRSGPQTWLLQLVLVLTGLWLASRPLRSALGERTELRTPIDTQCVTAW
jgi:hypothetical protein